MKYDVIVIGGGSAGSMAYLRSVLNYDNTLFLTGSAKTKKKSRAAWVHQVDNIPGLHSVNFPIRSATKSTIEWIKNHKHLAKKSTVISGIAESITGNEGAFKIDYSYKKENFQVESRYIILATGVMDIQPKINDKMEPFFPFANNGDLIYCLRCDGHHVIDSHLTIIGNDSSSIYIGKLMKERYGVPSITVLTNGEPYNFSDEAYKLKKQFNIEHFESPIVQVLGDAKNKGLEGYILANGHKVTTTKSIISLGTIVYNELLKPLNAKMQDSGRILVSQNFETSIPGIYAVGDIIANRKMQIYSAWDEAVDAADTINRNLRLYRAQQQLSKT